MMHAALEIAADHASFAGHFPTFPLLPGAVLLDEALSIIGDARALDLREWQIVVKFLEMVRPGDALRVEHDAPSPTLIRFTVHATDRKVASGTLSSVAAQDLSTCRPR